MIPVAGAAPASGGIGTAEVITGAVLALAAIISALTPLVLARRKSRKEALADAASGAMSATEMTLAGWTSLNAALQEEIRRLQGVQERMQARIDLLEKELAELQKLALGLQKGTGNGA